MNKKIAIVGATGAVGAEILEILYELEYEPDNLRLYASDDSRGRSLRYGDRVVNVEALRADSFEEIDFAFFAVPNNVATKWVPIAASTGCIVIDNSSVFRMDPDKPLVIPEINPWALAKHSGIITNPNCTTAIMLMALAPLHQKFRAEKVIASTYQAVSGAGKRGMEELRVQQGQVNSDTPVMIQVFPHQIALNVIPEVGKPLDYGVTSEEKKMRDESRKILNASGLKVEVTCVRVPVFRAHSISVTAGFGNYFTRQEAREVLRDAPGLQLMDNLEKHDYPTPLFATGHNDCFVGRIRKTEVCNNGLSFWISGDQLRRGAAWNAIRIYQELTGSDPGS